MIVRLYPSVVSFCHPNNKTTYLCISSTVILLTLLIPQILQLILEFTTAWPSGTWISSLQSKWLGSLLFWVTSTVFLVKEKCNLLICSQNICTSLYKCSEDWIPKWTLFPVYLKWEMRLVDCISVHNREMERRGIKEEDIWITHGP